MFRLPVLAVLCLAAVPAFAQAQPAPAQAAPAGPPPEVVNAIQQAGMTFSQCVQAGVPNVPATVTPEAGAASVLSGCSTQRQALDRAAEALVAALPEAQRPMVQEQIRSQLAGVEGQVVAGIRQMRASQTPAAASAPATTPAQ